ncbi:RibD family protein [Caldalkalibacillus salinus]|uniref:RibD family protein n=1 Tax=Caldalkalibacillus salinus TaxID=2803787 RepID=UPI0019204F22|nr:RibD family protein [Caldalkalibacillus salinus]
MNKLQIIGALIEQTKSKMQSGTNIIGIALEVDQVYHFCFHSLEDGHHEGYNLKDFHLASHIILTLDPPLQSELGKIVQEINQTDMTILGPFYDNEEKTLSSTVSPHNNTQIHYFPISEAANLYLPQYIFHQCNRPYILASWGMSIDGKIAAKTGDSKYISNGGSLHYVHALRNQSDGIMVGIGTVLQDDPKLTTRLKDTKQVNHPTRIILDSHLNIPEDSNIVKLTKEGVGHTIIFCERGPKPKKNDLTTCGIEVIEVNRTESGLDMINILEECTQRNIKSILVEGGSSVLGTLFDLDLVDRVKCTISPVTIGGTEAITPVGGKGILSLQDKKELEELERLEVNGDVIISGIVKGHQAQNYIEARAELVKI